MCLSKKQILTINEIKNDPDYHRLDNLILVEEISGREMIGGAIFIPLTNSAGASIGLIRQYFYDKIECEISKEKQQYLSTIFENCLRTSSIFENWREKIHYLQGDYFLKTINTINEMEKGNSKEI